MLPKINHPLFDVEVPSLKKNIKMRPMLVREEKILLMAKEGNDQSDIFSSVQQVVTNCIEDKTIVIDNLTIFDLEYLFLKLRSYSVSNKTKVSYRDNEDEKIYDFDIDLNDVKIIFPETVTENNIKINDTIGIKLKYPPATLYGNKDFINAQGESMFQLLVINSIEMIYDGDKIIDPKKEDQNELTQFVESLGINDYEKIKKFFEDLPKLNYEIKYTNKKGTERVILLSNLNDFFTLG